MADVVIAVIIYLDVKGIKTFKTNFLLHPSYAIAMNRTKIKNHYIWLLFASR